MTLRSKLMSACQKLGRSLMTPIAVLPIAGILLRFGQSDLLNLAWMVNAGTAVFDNLPIIFAVGIAIGFAEDNDGIAGLAAVVGYLILKDVSIAFDKSIDMGVLGGIIIGIISGSVYNSYKDVKLPDYLDLFSGKRFVPIFTSVCSVVLGVFAGVVWPLVQNAVNAFGNAVSHAGVAGAFVFGFFNRLLIPFGLHHVLDTLFWYQFGSFKLGSRIIHGDSNRFYALDKTAGTYMTGFFPIMMFALPAVCLAMITAAKKGNRKRVSVMLLGTALTAFVTGVTEPIEFMFMFISPVLYVIHAFLTGTSMALTSALGIRSGFTFSASFIDYLASFGIASKPLLLIIVGLIYGAIYYFVFLFVITKFNLPTLGREGGIGDNTTEEVED